MQTSHMAWSEKFLESFIEMLIQSLSKEKKLTFPQGGQGILAEGNTCAKIKSKHENFAEWEAI